jgi:hypothetical protein
MTRRFRNCRLKKNCAAMPVPRGRGRRYLCTARAECLDWEMAGQAGIRRMAGVWLVRLEPGGQAGRQVCHAGRVVHLDPGSSVSTVPPAAHAVSRQGNWARRLGEAIGQGHWARPLDKAIGQGAAVGPANGLFQPVAVKGARLLSLQDSRNVTPFRYFVAA